MVVDGRLVAALAAARLRQCQPVGEVPPAGVVESYASVQGGAAGERGPLRRARVGECRARRAPLTAGAVEQVEQRVELSERRLELRRLAEGQLDVAAGQPEPALGQPPRQQIAGAQVSGRTQVDALVPGRGDGVEQRDGIGDVRVDADGDLEGAVADRRVGEPQLVSGTVLRGGLRGRRSGLHQAMTTASSGVASRSSQRDVTVGTP